MPFPVLHSFTGYSMQRLCIKKDASVKRDWTMLMTTVFLANAADLDFIPGLLLHKGDQFHHGISHSLGAAVVCGFAVALILHFWQKRAFLKTFLFSAAVYYSHIVLDYFNGPGKGVLALWPFTSRQYNSQFAVFALRSAEMKSSAGFGDFIISLLQSESIKRFTLEVLIVFLSCSLAWFLKELERKTRLRESIISSTLAAVLLWIFVVMA